MFSMNIVLNKLIRFNYKEIVRNHKKVSERKLIANDPGLAKRKHLVDNKEDLQELADYDFDLESDFMNVGASHAQHMKEARLKKEKERYIITRQKYFKESFPNFLTWSDKEQIRFLYSTNPEEWSFKKLSDGFPALPHVIKKIATSNWSKKSETSIKSHDESVIKNWKLFTEDKLADLPEELTEHLKKFGNRHKNIKPYTSNESHVNTDKSMLAPNIKIGNEFSNIITSYERLKNKEEPNPDLTNKNHKINKPPKEDTFMTKSYVNSTHTTLGKLQENIENKSKSKKISQDEQLILKAFQENEKEIVLPNSLISKKFDCVEESKSKSSNLAVIVKDKKDYTHLEYPEKITIPKTILKEGYTYKLNDCYYDDDGEFLYRVPGMSN